MLTTKLYDLLTKQETYLIRKGSDIRNVMIECLEVGELIALYPYLCIQLDIQHFEKPDGVTMLNRVIVELKRRKEASGIVCRVNGQTFKVKF